MFLALSSRNKFGFVDGSIAEPDSSSPLYNSWSRCNATVLSLLTNSLSLDLKASVMYINNARDLWIDLKDRLSQGNTPRLFELGKEIAHLQQGSLSVSSLQNSRPCGMSMQITSLLQSVHVLVSVVLSLLRLMLIIRSTFLDF